MKKRLWAAIIGAAAVTTCGLQRMDVSPTALAAEESFDLSQRTLAGAPALELMEAINASGVLSSRDQDGREYWQAEKLQCSHDAAPDASPACRLEWAGRQFTAALLKASLLYQTLVDNDAVAISAAGSSVGTAYDVLCVKPVDLQEEALCHFTVAVRH